MVCLKSLILNRKQNTKTVTSTLYNSNKWHKRSTDNQGKVHVVGYLRQNTSWNFGGCRVFLKAPTVMCWYKLKFKHLASEHQPFILVSLVIENENNSILPNPCRTMRMKQFQKVSPTCSRAILTLQVAITLPVIPTPWESLKQVRVHNNFLSIIH